MKLVMGLLTITLGALFHHGPRLVAVSHLPDGSDIVATDVAATMRLNWPSYSLYFIGAVILAWGVLDWARHLIQKGRSQQESGHVRK